MPNITTPRARTAKLRAGARWGLWCAPVVLAGLTLAGCASSTGSDAATSSSPPAGTPGSTSGAPASGTQAPPSGVVTALPDTTPVPAGELVALISDRTFTGTYEGQDYQEYYDPQGGIRGTEAGQAYTGTWELRDDQLCFTYPQEGSQETEANCYTAAIAGSTVYWFGDSEPISTTFVEGNPGNL